MDVTWSSILSAIGSYGFPIIVTIYLLWERYMVTSKQAEATNKALTELTTAVTLLTEYIKGGEKN